MTGRRNQHRRLEFSSVAILVSMTTDWRLIRQNTDYVAAPVGKLSPGDYVEFTGPPTAL
jgi:hypothetical protein